MPPKKGLGKGLDALIRPAGNKTSTQENSKKTEDKKKTEQQLYFCLNEAGKAFELLDIKKYKHILGNIIYLGLEETFIKELNKE